MLLNRFEQKAYQTEPVPCAETKVLPATEMIQEGDSIDSGPLAVRLLPRVRRRAALRRMRRIFIALALLVIVALLVDGILVSLVSTHPSHSIRRGAAFPLLTLTPGIAYLGQVVQLRLSHFPASSHALLTRDVRESLRLDAPSPLIQIDASGNATVHMLIEGNWGVGAHFIAAEDISTRYTASETLQVMGSGPVLPPQLQLSQPFLDMGLDWPGANTLHALKLSNSGGGSISWIAKSNQPWLQVTPAQGVFSDNQTISVVATRIYMKTGTYQGALTILSNTGVSAFIQVKMSVRALPASGEPILSVVPPVLAFSAIDGEREPADQLVTINNPGLVPLEWSVVYNAPTATVNQSIPFQAKNWLSVFPASGVLPRGASATIHIQVHSRVLFPGIYSGLLSISGRKALDTPQVVAISLSVLNSNPADQAINLNVTGTCSLPVSWQASSSSSDWLVISPFSGSVNGAASSVNVHVDTAGKLLGNYNGQVTFSAQDSTGARIKINSQTVSVTLDVLG